MTFVPNNIVNEIRERVYPGDAFDVYKDNYTPFIETLKTCPKAALVSLVPLHPLPDGQIELLRATSCRFAEEKKLNELNLRSFSKGYPSTFTISSLIFESNKFLRSVQDYLGNNKGKQEHAFINLSHTPEKDSFLPGSQIGNIFWNTAFYTQPNGADKYKFRLVYVPDNLESGAKKDFISISHKIKFLNNPKSKKTEVEEKVVLAHVVLENKDLRNKPFISDNYPTLLFLNRTEILKHGVGKTFFDGSPWNKNRKENGIPSERTLNVIREITAKMNKRK